MKKHKILLLVFLFSIVETYSQKNEWLTYYEKSGYTATPGYEETMSFCKRLAVHSPFVDLQYFGKSARGRDLPLMIIDKNGNFTKEKVGNSGNAILFIEAGIHPGEIVGKDAVLMFLRDIIIHEKYLELLDHVTILFIPIFNVDGHERISAFNRINQNGPVEMGWRTNAQNLNLNRDFLKADSPEMQDWLKLFNKWLPDFFIDIHTTDGADYQYVLTYVMEIHGNMDKGLTQWCKNTYIPEIESKMNKAGFPVFEYIAFRRWFDPTSGLRTDVAPPRLSQGYVALQNRPGLLIETHMLKPYKERIASVYEITKITLKIIDKQYSKLIELNKKADLHVSDEKFRNYDFPLRFKRSDKDSTMIDFKGYEYDIVYSDITNADWFKYDQERPKTFKLPYFNTINVDYSVKLPEAYIIPPEWDAVIYRLKLHGVNMYKLKKLMTIESEIYKFKTPQWQNNPYEGRHPLTEIDYDIIIKEITYPKGSMIVPTNQRAARVIANILEPKAEDSYVFWGFFDAIFEQKEYSEVYIMEEMAREMIKENPDVLKEFEQWKTEHPQAAENQWLQLNWFFSKTPYWDEKKNIYPVGRIMTMPE